MPTPIRNASALPRLSAPSPQPADYGVSKLNGSRSASRMHFPFMLPDGFARGHLCSLRRFYLQGEKCNPLVVAVPYREMEIAFQQDKGLVAWEYSRHRAIHFSHCGGPYSKVQRSKT